MKKALRQAQGFGDSGQRQTGLTPSLMPPVTGGMGHQWNCSSSVEPVRAFTLDEPPWITVVTSSK